MGVALRALILDSGWWISRNAPCLTIFLLSALVSPLSFFPLFMHMHGRILPSARFRSPTAPRSLSCTGWKEDGV
ncbi:hypothetical protein B0H14DRAFT_2940641, partial [Mycena olivaceomarginata]